MSRFRFWIVNGALVALLGALAYPKYAAANPGECYCHVDMDYNLYLENDVTHEDCVQALPCQGQCHHCLFFYWDGHDPIHIEANPPTTIIIYPRRPRPASKGGGYTIEVEAWAPCKNRF